MITIRTRPSKYIFVDQNVTKRFLGFAISK